MEQILLWDPDYIVFAPDSIYAEVGDDATWQTLYAVQNGNYCEVPDGPNNWMGFRRAYSGIWACCGWARCCMGMLRRTTSMTKPQNFIGCFTIVN